MTDVFLSLAMIAAAGISIRFIFPELEVDLFRQNINKLVLYFILPALIFNVMYHAPAGNEFFQVPIAASVGIVSTLLIAWVIFGLCSLPSSVKGVLILASAFSNVTYLGLPVLQGIFPDIPDKIAVVPVLFEVTTTPLLLSLGVFIAMAYGSKTGRNLAAVALRILKLPPLWALALALAWKVLPLPVPGFFVHATKTLGSAASGLMILSLGMALKFRKPRFLKSIGIAVLLQLFFIPLTVYGIGKILQIGKPYFEASVIEAAMPTQLLTLVVADEFGLDVETLAFVILLSTVLSFLTIPVVRALLF